jgi:uncharacterized membrane protein YkgB
MNQESPRLEAIDFTISQQLSKVAMPLLRISLAVVYIWFGVLKIAGVSPVADIVARTIPFLPKQWVVRFLGVWEVAIGVALLFRVALRPTLVLYALQLVGTFLTFVTQPDRMIQKRNPLLLTTEGEFVLKNIVLLAAGVAVGSTVRRAHEELPATDTELQK